VDVTNSGSVKGKEAVLLFSRDNVASLTPDVRRLRGFEKISLNPGETQTVTFTLAGSDLAFVNAQGKWTLEEGDFMLQAGDQTVGIHCTATKIWEKPNKIKRKLLKVGLMLRERFWMKRSRLLFWLFIFRKVYHA